jgi:hypothetical protein
MSKNRDEINRSFAFCNRHFKPESPSQKNVNKPEAARKEGLILNLDRFIDPNVGDTTIHLDL